MASPGLILDRDGTVTEERGYVTHRDELELLPYAVDALERAREAGWIAVLVTNQSVVGRGLLDEAELHRMHDELAERLGLRRVYACLHLPDDGCSCRKPAPGLLVQAIEDLDLDRARTAYVGDNISDVMAAIAARITPVLVRTGHGRRFEREAIAVGAIVVDHVGEAVDRLIGLAHD